MYPLRMRKKVQAGLGRIHGEDGGRRWALSASKNFEIKPSSHGRVARLTPTPAHDRDRQAPDERVESQQKIGPKRRGLADERAPVAEHAADQ